MHFIFEWNKDLIFDKILSKIGIIPLPPYLKRDAEDSDYDNYQTIYSQKKGSIAAPTAGLHFTVDRKVVVATLKVREGNYEKVKELLDAETGLPTTRAYDGCTHLEATYNEENNTYFIIEYWESFEKYNAYLDWRLNDDPSGAAAELSKYLVGGSNGLVPHTNNIGYKFY